MIKLTNREAHELHTPIAVRLFSDPRRPFPTKDAFLLLDIVDTVKDRVERYHEQFRKIVSEYNGTFDPNGAVRYVTEEESKDATEKIKELNEIELEYPIEPLIMNDDWPRLSLAEASILKPLIKNGKKPLLEKKKKPITKSGKNKK